MVEAMFLEDLSVEQRGQLFGLLVTPLDQLQWVKCSQCGGDNPRGEMLVKAQSVSLSELRVEAERN